MWSSHAFVKHFNTAHSGLQCAVAQYRVSVALCTCKILYISDKANHLPGGECTCADDSAMFNSSGLQVKITFGLKMALYLR